MREELRKEILKNDAEYPTLARIEHEKNIRKFEGKPVNED